MTRLIRLSLFALIVVVLLVGGSWLFRTELLRMYGVSFDSGAPGQTTLQLPEGFASNVFAYGLSRPRFMAVSSGGVLFVAEPGNDRVVALPDRDADGRADETLVVGTGYEQAHSLAFARDGSLLVAGTGTLFSVSLDEELREADRRAILSYPPGGAHSTRTVVVAPDGSLLLSIGSTCNVCWEEDAERAAILHAPPEGGTAGILMRGLRNAVGVAIDPETGTAWATNNGRDMLGDDMPPETLYRVEDGVDAGWPRCHAGDLPDPDLGDEPDPRSGLAGCEAVAAPAATFQAHAAPLGIAFWRGDAVIAFHGSWNRSSKVGYQVVRLPWEDGPAGPPSVLVAGFLDPGTGDASGRPAGLIVGADDALYVSDDKGGFVYRIAAPHEAGPDH